MEEETATTPTRKPPGPIFFMGAMAVYLLLVHGTSLLSAGLPGTVPPLGEHPEIPGYLRVLLEGLAETLGHSRAAFACLGLVLLYACMLGLFQLTRHLVKGPVWLGSLAATSFMAHPVKTEVLFTALGPYYLLSALFAILTVLGYVLLIESPNVPRYLAALALFACAAFPFAINGGLFGVLFLLEFYPARPETRRWHRLVPFLGVAMFANWFHMETLYIRLPAIADVVAPLLLLIYPIGLLPETLAHLAAFPAMAWLWGAFALALVALAFAGIKNGAFRVCLLALLMFRYFPGAHPIDFTTLDGGAQLIFPLALGCVALAALSRWLMRYEAWGRPTVTLTTMLCVVLFVLQFQANRDVARRDSGPVTDVKNAVTQAPVTGGAATQSEDRHDPVE